MRAKPWLDGGDDVTIRRALADDAAALRALATLSETRPLRGDVLVAEVDGELWAALDLDDGRLIADPFRPTAGARRLLVLRRESLAAAAGAVGRLRAWRHRFA
jgi:hypothetical protein